MKCDTVNS